MEEHERNAIAMELSAVERNSIMAFHKSEMDQVPFKMNETQIKKPSLSTASTTSFTSFYHPTPSPADSGVMSPLTPLSNYTASISGPNCTPEQNVISSPEHSVTPFPGYSLSNGCESSTSSVCSPYSTFHQYTNPSPDPTNPAITTFHCSIPTNSLTDETCSTSSATLMTNQFSEENVNNLENISYSCQAQPSFYLNNFRDEQNWIDYSQNLTIQYHHSPLTLQQEQTVRMSFTTNNSSQH